MKGKSVRLRRATIDDYDFCKQLYDDISYEILYGNRKAFGLPEIENDEEDDFEIDFEEPKLTKDWFEKAITIWRHKVYIIEIKKQRECISIGYFYIAKSGKGESNRIRSWRMLEEYFDWKEETLKCLLKRKELINKKITINILKTDCEFEWLVEKFGFGEDDSVLSTLSLINQS